MTNDVQLQAKATPKKRKKLTSLDRRKARAGWFFILPFLIGFVVIYLPMIYDSIMLTFHTEETVTGGLGYVLHFVGWDNYKEAIIVKTDFAETLVTGLLQLAFDIPAILIFSLFMAVLLNQKMVGRGFFRAIFFLPVILATGIMDVPIDPEQMEGESIDDGSGEAGGNQLVSSMDLAMLFSNMKIGGELVTIVTDMVNNIFNIVNRSGVQMLIFLAGLQSISPAIYESCKIDGATSWETFWKITFPMISPMILVNAVYTVIDSFTSSSNPVMEYINKVYGGTNGKVVSSAMAWVYFLIIILIVALIASICSAFVFYQRKND